ncbi:MAG: enoyl-CoA hydratase-related protein [Myxococcota bacterium]|nr:enoyl-CoA hydratase-related protein [Myxococcota bacterium]
MAAVDYQKRDGIGIVTIDRPEARNALSPEVVVLLDRYFQQASDDDEVRVLVLTGAGDKSFCAGADLARLIPLMSGQREASDEWDRAVLDDPRVASRANLQGEPISKPVIAALNGHAMGGGLELAMAADLRIAAEGIRLGLPEVKRALFPGGGGVVRLSRLIPATRALELSLTGDAMEVDEALALGLVTRVVPREALLDAAFELAGRIARNGPLAVRAILQVARATDGLPIAEALALSSELGMPVFRTEDATEGARAFIEKREPVYRGC